MREIKFRAWDKVSECWRHFSLYDISRLRENDWFFTDFENWCEYTGLKDKNGKEIYEGDIVRMLYTDWGDEERDKMNGLVEFRGDSWQLNFGKGRFGDDEYGYLRPGTHGYMEIIGNIYENPELLTNL